MFYEEVFKTLNEYKVKYVVAGGVAVVLHGVVRFTADLDLIVELSEENLEKFYVALGEIGYIPKVPVKKEEFKDAKKREEWKKEKRMKVFSFVNLNEPLKLIDMFVDEYIKYDIVDSHKLIKDADGIGIPIISIKHLKKLKSISARPQDLIDIGDLERIEKLRNEKA